MKLSIFNLHRSSTPASSDQPALPVEPADQSEEGTLSQPSTPPASEWSGSISSADQLDQSQSQLPPAPAIMQELRLRILNNVCITASVLGVIVLLTNYFLASQDSTGSTFTDRTTLALYGVTCVGLFVITFVRHISSTAQRSYIIRASLLLIFLFIIGASTLAMNNLYSTGVILLISLPFFAALLLGPTGRASLLILSIAVMIITGLLVITGMISPPLFNPGASISSLLTWLASIASFTILSITGVLSIATTLNGLENHLNNQQTLIGELDHDRKHLQERVQQRTSDLQRRLLQIRTAAEITRSISQVLDIEVLLPQICELMRERFGLYYVGVFLVESEIQSMPGTEGEATAKRLLPRMRGSQYAMLVAGTGEAGKRMVAEGHRLIIGGASMIGWAIAHGQARIALDVGKEAARFNNPYLPKTRSELALPILGSTSPSSASATPHTEGYSDVRVLGALTIQSDQESAFDQDDIIVLQGIADNLASAIENARLFTATRASLEEVKMVHRQYLESAWLQEVATLGTLEYTFGTPSQSEAARTLQVPLRLRDQIIGHLTLELEPESASESQAEQKPADELALIEAVAAQAALALENARLLEETRRKATQERLAANISSKVWASIDIDTILRTALQEVGGSLNVRDGWIEIQPQETR